MTELSNKIATSINGPIFALPVVLVTAGNNENRNVMTAAWASKICMEPPSMCVAIRQSRLTHSLILEAECFALNLPNVDLVRAVDMCGTLSGRDEDKFELCGFTSEPGPETGAPIIRECPITFECTLTNTVNIGSHDLFIGKVVSRLVNPEILGTNGREDYTRIRPIVYLSPYYTTQGEVLGNHGFTLQK